MFERAVVKIPFDKSQVFFASETACGFGEFGGDCYVREELDETIATLLETWIAVKTVQGKSPELFRKE